MKPITPTNKTDLFPLFSLCASSFSIGFFLYMLIEKIFKTLFSSSKTHWSMGVLAGFSFLFLLVLDQKKLPLVVKAIFGSLFITTLELIAGIILNLRLHLGVWDYRDRFLNFQGQICPLYSLVWVGASFAIIGINRLLCRFFFQTKKRQDD